MLVYVDVTEKIPAGKTTRLYQRYSIFRPSTGYGSTTSSQPKQQSRQTSPDNTDSDEPSPSSRRKS